MNRFGNIKVYKKAWLCFLTVLLTVTFALSTYAQDTSTSETPDSIDIGSTIESVPVLDSVNAEPASLSEELDTAEPDPTEGIPATEDTPTETEEIIEETPEEETPAETEDQIEETPEEEAPAETEDQIEETPEEEIPSETEDPVEEPLVSVTTIEATPAEEVEAEEKPPTPIPLFKPTLGIGLGLFTYYGDLKPYKYSSRIVDNLGYDFTISTRINKYLTLGLYFIKGKMTTDEKSATRNLNFESKISIGGISISHNFGNWIKEESKIHPYMFLGIEAFEFSSKTDSLDANGRPYYYWADGTIRVEDETGSNPNAATTERDYVYESDLRESNLDGLGKYSQFSFGIPVGVGIEFKIMPRLRLNLSTAMHFTFTDLIDNVSASGVGVREGNAGLERFLYTSLSLHFDLFPPDPPEEPEDTTIAEVGDQDNDGVNDDKDLCPDTPEIAEVDSVGCPLDDDEDGVGNYRDWELDTPPGVPVDTNGVQIQDTTSRTPGDSVWTVLLGAFPEGEYPSEEFTDKILSIPGVQCHVINDTTFYIKGLFDNPEDAAGEKIGLDELGLKVTKVVLWNPRFDPFVIIDSTIFAAKLKIAQPRIEDQVIYRVQLGAFSKQIDTKFFGMVDVVMLPGKDGLFKYLTVDNANFEQAHEMRKDMVATGFDDAFVVAYKNGERVTMESIGSNLDEKGNRI